MGGWGLYPWGRRTVLELESGSDNGSIVLPRWDLTDEKGFQDMTIKIIRHGHFLCALWDDREGLRTPYTGGLQYTNDRNSASIKPSLICFPHLST